MLTLFYRATCPRSLGVRIVLAEKGLRFLRRVVAGDEKPAELEDVTESGMPALIDDSFGVLGATAVVEYIEEAFTRPALRPPDPRGRAMVRMAMVRIEDELVRPMDAMPAPPGHARAASSLAVAEHERVMNPFAHWDGRMGDNGHLFGMDFSLADAWLAAALEKAMSFGVPMPVRFERLGVWWERMGRRASIRAERFGHEL